MKRYHLLFLLVPLLLVAAGCSKYPLSVWNSGNQVGKELFDDPLKARILVESALNQAHVSEGFLRNDCAVIINDKSLLNAVYVEELGLLEWPEIDFNKHSLVIGQWIYAAGNEYLAKQSIRVTPGNAILFLEIKRTPGGGTADVFYRWFAALYPKLPDLPVQISRKNSF